MKSTHQIHIADARKLSSIVDPNVELVVTSPPYPMIEMWDEVFSTLNSNVETALTTGNATRAYECMHEELNSVWDGIDDILTTGGIVCINIGDATRTIDGEFQLFPNHAKIIDYFQTELGYTTLPPIHWRKPTNSSAKFMGSGMQPPNAYITQEQEYILIFRNGEKRDFPPKYKQRRESAYFWEERNRWFSDEWDHETISGVDQNISDVGDEEVRDRSAAYPFLLPYRLINMFSTYSDTVCDPFVGTGTTTAAAIAAGRNSIGVEIDEQIVDWFTDNRVGELKTKTQQIISKRLTQHLEYVESLRENGEYPEYTSKNYDFPVTTQDEREIKFYKVNDIEQDDNRIRVTHTPIGDVDDIDIESIEGPQMKLTQMD